MKLQDTCKGTEIPKFADLKAGDVYANGSGHIRIKVYGTNVGSAYIQDPISGNFFDRNNVNETTVTKVYPNATLVLEPSK